MVLLVLLPAAAAYAQRYAASTNQPPDFVRSHYTKREYRIAMRDGVKLFTSVYTPKDHSRQYPHPHAADSLFCGTVRRR